MWAYKLCKAINTHGTDDDEITYLVEKCVAHKEINCINYQSRGGRFGGQEFTPLCVACQRDRADIVLKLLQAGADPDIKVPGRSEGYFNISKGHKRPIHFVCGKLEVNIEILANLIKYSVDVNGQSSTGETALHMLCDPIWQERAKYADYWNEQIMDGEALYEANKYEETEMDVQVETIENTDNLVSTNSQLTVANYFIAEKNVDKHVHLTAAKLEHTISSVIENMLRDSSDIYPVTDTPTDSRVGSCVGAANIAAEQLHLVVNVEKTNFAKHNTSTIGTREFTEQSTSSNDLAANNVDISVADGFPCASNPNLVFSNSEEIFDDPAITEGLDETERNMLTIAAKRLKAVALLLKHGATVEIEDLKGYTPLMSACKFRDAHYTTILKLFVCSGCDVNYPDGKPLQMLVDNPNYFGSDLIELMISAGSNVTLSNYMATAGYRGKLDVMNLFHKYGVDMNMLDEYGSTALQTACRANNSAKVEAIKLLLKWGSDVNMRSSPMLYYNGIPGHPSAMETVNNTKIKDCTALHNICKTDNVTSLEIIRILLSYGANVNIENKSGCTPLDCLFENGRKLGKFNHLLVPAELLLTAGSRIISNWKVAEEMKMVEMTWRLNPNISQQKKDEIQEFLDALLDIVNQPKPLVDICRIQIRACLGEQIRDKVKVIGIPKSIQSFLLFK